jgi:hypothetical protein
MFPGRAHLTLNYPGVNPGRNHKVVRRTLPRKEIDRFRLYSGAFRGPMKSCASAALRLGAAATTLG